MPEIMSCFAFPPRCCCRSGNASSENQAQKAHSNLPKNITLHNIAVSGNKLMNNEPPGTTLCVRLTGFSYFSGPLEVVAPIPTVFTVHHGVASPFTGKPSAQPATAPAVVTAQPTAKPSLSLIFPPEQGAAPANLPL